MNNYLCANRHHFRSPNPTCPTPGCTAEVRPTAVSPLEGRAPAFEKLPRLTVVIDELAPAPTEEQIEQILKHRFKWWTYVNGERVRWFKGCDEEHIDATCSCGWDSATGGESIKAVEKLTREHKKQ